MKYLNRRHFLGAGLLLGAATLLGKETPAKPIAIPQEYTPPIIAFPEKKPMVTISDRPPLLKSSKGREIFTQAITPNDEFFVRWHLPDIPQIGRAHV